MPSRRQITLDFSASSPFGAIVWSTILAADVIAKGIWAPSHRVVAGSKGVATKITPAANPKPVQVLQPADTRITIWAC